MRRSGFPLPGCSVVLTGFAPGLIVSSDCLQSFLIAYHLVSDGASNSCSVATLAPIQRRSALLTVTPSPLDALVLVIVAPVHILIVVPVVEVLDVAPVPPLLQGGLAPSPILFSAAWLVFTSPLLA